MSTTTQTGNQPPSRDMLPSKEKKGLKKIMPIGCKIVGLTGCGFDPNVKPELLPDEDPDRLVWWVFDGDFPQSRPTEPYLYLPESVYYDEYFQSIVSYNEFKERSKKEQEGGEISKEEEDITYGAWVYVETNERYGFGKVRNILSEDAQDTKIA